MIVVSKMCQHCGKENKVIETDRTPVRIPLAGYSSDWLECSACHYFSIVLKIDLTEKEKVCVPLD